VQLNRRNWYKGDHIEDVIKEGGLEGMSGKTVMRELMGNRGFDTEPRGNREKGLIRETGRKFHHLERAKAIDI
jgi:hypothetical protein